MEEYPPKALCDTSVYIPFINQGIIHPVLVESVRPVLYMSMVVLTELYAGSYDVNSIKLVDKLYNTFLGVKRLIVPNDEDWRKAGMTMVKLGNKYGFESRYISKIQNDILIASSAQRVGAFVITNNKKDFVRIKEFVDFRIYG